MKGKNTTLAEQFQNQSKNRRGKFYNPSTHIHDHSPSLLGINTSNKMGGVGLVLCAKTS
jgi:hypothetical protein